MDPLLQKQLATLHTSLDISDVLHELIHVIRKQLPVDQAAVLLWNDPPHSFWVIDLAVQEMESLNLSSQTASFAYLQRRAKDRKWPQWSYHYGDPAHFNAGSFFAGQPCPACLCVDIKYQNRHIGLLYIGSLQPRGYDNQTEQCLSRIVQVGAGAVGRAWQHTLLQHRLDKLSTLIEIQHAITLSKDEEAFPTLVTASMAEVLGVAAGQVYRIPESSGRLELLSSYIGPFGKTIRTSDLLKQIEYPKNVASLEEAMRTGCHVVLNSSRENNVAEDMELLTSSGCETLVALPLTVKGRSVGLIVLLDRRYREFSYDDLELVQTMAQQVATMLERQRLTSETAYLQEFSNRVFEAVRDMIYVHDLEGNLTLVNQRAVALTGFEREDLLQMNIRDLVIQEDREKVLALSATSDGQMIKPFEISIVTRQGAEIPMQINTSPLYQGSHVVGVVGVLRDQRDQKRWREQLVRGERLRALGQMAGSVAHDFNNLLAVVMGRVQLALREAGDNADLHTDLEAILEAAQSGAQTVRRMQSFARKRTDRLFDPININDVIRESIEWAQPQLERHSSDHASKIDLSLFLQPVPHVAALESEMREILDYLISNAIEALPEGGHILISTSLRGDQVVLQCTDDGVGIPSKVLPHIFEPFYTTKGQHKNGLGLSIAYGTITRYGGEIDVTSEEGKGTTVTVRLPVTPIKGPTAPRLPARVSPSPIRRRRILVVEDEDQVRNLVTKLLRSDGHHVIAKPDGASALISFAEQPFDIVFTDLGMPGLSGWEVAQRIREQNATIPIVLVTGWGTEVDPEKLQRTGVTRVVTKPFRLEDIQSCLSLLCPPE